MAGAAELAMHEHARNTARGFQRRGYRAGDQRVAGQLSPPSSSERGTLTLRAGTMVEMACL
jgi:hypothetical protein